MTESKDLKNIKKILGLNNTTGRPTILSAPLHVNNLFRQPLIRQKFYYPSWWGHEEAVSAKERIITSRIEDGRPPAGLPPHPTPVYTVQSYACNLCN